MKVKHLIYVIAICAVGFLAAKKVQWPSDSATDVSAQQAIMQSDSSQTASAVDQAGIAYQNHQSNTQVTATGRVVKVLPDDNKGSRHQRFIIELGSGQTLLVAHNIDLAGYVDGLTEGSQVTVSGEYEWNDKGGVVHWTHHDPRGEHPGGWIKFNGNTYQ